MEDMRCSVVSSSDLQAHIRPGIAVVVDGLPPR